MFAPHNGDGGGGYQDDLNNILLCPDCKVNPPNLTEEFSSGDMVCADCGVVVGNRIIDTRSEWRTFANDDQAGDDPSRVGGPQDEFADGEQLSTTVAFSETKAHKALSRTQNNANQDKSQKGLSDAYKLIVTWCDTANMGQNVTNAAKHIIKLAEQHRILRGKPQEHVISGAIFIACRQNKAARSFKEIHNLTKVPKKEIGKMYKALSNFLGKVSAEGQGKGVTNLNTVTTLDQTSSSATELCGRFVDQLGFNHPQQVAKIARDLTQQASGISTMAGRSPLSVAAACIYMACHLVGEERASQLIAKVAGVSDGTVKTAYKHLFSKRDQLIRPEWIEEGIKVDKLPLLQG